MKRVLVCFIVSLLTGHNAMAREWVMDSVGNYNLVAGKQALMLECHAAKPGESTPLEPTLFYYYPPCKSGCKATPRYDDNNLASIIIDGKNFPIRLGWGDADAILLSRATQAPDFFEALATAKNITIYSSQMQPSYTAFDFIANSEVLQTYYEDCVGGKK